MAADPERAQAIENSLLRTLRNAVEELPRNPDRTASMLGQATTQLNSSDAQEHLTPEKRAEFLGKVAELQKQVDEAERAEKASRIERDVKRYLTNLEDEIRTNGSQIESYLSRAETRLTAAEVRETLLPDTLAALQAQFDELRAKVPGAPPPKAAPPAPERAVSTPPPAPSAPPVTANAPPTPQRAVAPQPAPASAQLSEVAERAVSNITRTLRLAAGEIDAPNWRSAESYVEQAAKALESSGGQELPSDMRDGFRKQIADLEAKLALKDREEKIQEIEEQMGRLVRDAQEHVGWPDRIGGMLKRIAEALEYEKTQTYLPEERKQFYRNEIARLDSSATGSQTQKAIDDATESLVELEQRVTDSMFEGLDERAIQQLWGDTERFEKKVGWALEKLPADDVKGKEIKARLDAAVARRSAAYEGTKARGTLASVVKFWDEFKAKIAGWEKEEQDTSAGALGNEILPKTRAAVREVRDAISGSSLHSPIPEARKEYASDATVAKIVAEGERIIEKGLARLAAAFDAIMDAAEKLETPTGEFELRAADFMRMKATDAFEHSDLGAPREERARALHAHWVQTIEMAREAREAYYAKLSAEAADAWPAIAKSIKAHDGFNPVEEKWKGKTVRINGLRNRVGWDFGGDFHLSMWFNDMPVAGDFSPRVLEAFQAAQKETRTTIDDHSDWDAVLVIEGPGKVRQRFIIPVKKDGEKIGEIEEYRPVDCVMCKVIALRAGPCAIGPE